MRPLVIDELLADLWIYGSCAYQVVDNYHEFSIKRIDLYNKKRKLPYVRF